jgi:hypothetical protein
LLALLFFNPTIPFIQLTTPFNSAAAAMNSTIEQVMAELPLHPFSPFITELPTYVPNTLSALPLVSIFGAGCVVIFGITYGIIQRMRPSMGAGEVSIALWFALCGCIHLFFEGE